MLLNNFGLKNYFIPIFIFLSGITAKLSSVQVHHFFTFPFLFLFVSFFVFNIIYNKYSYYFDLKLLVIILTYILWCLFTVLISEYQSVALISLIRIVIFFIVIFGIYNYINSFFRINLLLKSISYVGTVISISIIADFIFNRLRLISSDGTVIRYSGIFTSINAAGFVIGISMVIIAFFYINSRSRFYFLLFILNLIGIALTFSRSAWIMVVITLVPFILSRYVSREFFSYILVSLLLIIFSLAYNSDKVIQFLRLDKGTNGRDIIWNAAIDLVKDNPMGVGIGCLRMEIINYYDVPKGSLTWKMLQDTADDAHNLYLTVTSEIGWIGFLILLLALGYFFKVLASNFRRTKATYSLEKLFFYLFIGFIARSFFEGIGFLTKGWIGIDIYMWIVFCISLKIPAIDRTGYS